MGTVTNLKEWKEKKAGETLRRCKAWRRELTAEEEPIDDAFEMAQNMYDSRKDRMLENLDSAILDAVKKLEETSSKVLEDAKKRT